VYVGREYFEFWQYFRPDDPLLVRPWVDWATEGVNGIIALGLRTNDLDEPAAELRGRGVTVSGPEQPVYPLFWGLLKFRPPWRQAFVAPFPDVYLQLFLLQYSATSAAAISRTIATRTAPGASGTCGSLELLVRLPWTSSDASSLTWARAAWAPPTWARSRSGSRGSRGQPAMTSSPPPHGMPSWGKPSATPISRSH